MEVLPEACFLVNSTPHRRTCPPSQFSFYFLHALSHSHSLDFQIAGAYPGLTEADVMAVTSEEAPEPGQWAYDFSDPDWSAIGGLWRLKGLPSCIWPDDPVGDYCRTPIHWH
jgi:hypothetical protein